MLILLSPAKNMDSKSVYDHPEGTLPLFRKEADYLATQMQTYSREQLQLLLQISNKLTDINYQRYQEFNAPDTITRPAILAYTGNVYQHIHPQTFTDEDFRYAQDHLRILSTLYGLIRPLDLIKAYRITFKIKLKGLAEKDLYAYWLPKLTDPLIQSVRQSNGILVNLASLDILGALQMDKIEKNVTVITPEFKEFRKGKYETIRTHAKMARGEMTRFILLNRIENPERIKDFTWEGFVYNRQLSDPAHYIFTQEIKNG